MGDSGIDADQGNVVQQILLGFSVSVMSRSFELPADFLFSQPKANSAVVFPPSQSQKLS